jgi:hypothetical protein
MPAVEQYSPTGDPYIDGLLDGVKWATTTLSFSFPTNASFYEGSPEAQNNFEAFTPAQQNAMRQVLEQISSVAGLSFNEVTETASVHGTLRYAETDATDTAYAYTPHPSEAGGDSWYNNSSNDFENPVKGTWAYTTFLHETGHALGLKHPHSQEGAFPPMPADRDSTEYSAMSYRSYIGGPLGGGFTNGPSSFPQTLMMFDIAALQELYGANYTTHSGNTVYSWSPLSGEMFIDGIGQQAPAGNKIFMTIWDGGGEDTYDFSNYANAVTVRLQPGAWSICSGVQRADLGNGRYAAGNIANALLHDNNPASLIENAICGAGTDSIVGNIADNRFTGGGGNDTLTGAAGADTAIYSGSFEDYRLTPNADGTWSITDLRIGSPDGIDTLRFMEFCEFDDMTYTLGAPPPPPPSDFDGDGKSDVLWQNDDGRAAVWLVNGTTVLNTAVVGPNPGPAWHIEGTGDFDLNGRSDIVWQHNDGRVSIWFLNGLNLTGSGGIANNPGPSWDIIDTGHFNADGKSDLLWQNNDGRAAVWTLDGTAQTGAAIVGGNPGSTWHVKASGDFNGDGKSDILWQNSDGRAGVWILDGMNFVSGAVVSENPGPTWHIKDSGDFNGDGKSDILWQNDDGRAAIWFIDGLSFMSGSVVGSNAGPAWQAESAADYNGDGKADILWQHDNGQAGIWLMDGFGVLDSDLVGANPGTAWHVDWI